MFSSPYIVSNWVEGVHFYGREALCQALLTRGERCIYLVGTRRVGKTSLLRRLATLLGTHGIYTDLMQAASQSAEQEILDEGRMVRLLRHELARHATQHGGLLSSREIWDRQENNLGAWLEEASWAWESQNLLITLLWDEAEMLRRLSTATLMRLRAVFQQSRSLRLVVCASKGLAAINDRWRGDDVSPFLFGFRTQPLAGLEESAALELISQRGTVQVDPSVAARICAITGNHPFLLQMLCDRLYQPGRLRSPSEVDMLVDAPLADLFRIDVAQLSPSEQAILSAVARHGSLAPADLHSITGLNHDTIASFAEGMAQLGYLRTTTTERWEPGNNLLARWLRSHTFAANPAITDQATLEVVDAELQQLELTKVVQRRRVQELQASANSYTPGELPADLSSELAELQAAIAALEQRMRDYVRQKAATTPLEEPLSERELSVLRLMATGMRNAEIAARLIVSENTIKAHVKHIYRKLGVNDRVQAANRARALGLL